MLGAEFVASVTSSCPRPFCLVLRIRTHASCPISCEYDVWFGDLAWPLAVDLRLHLPALTASFWCALLARTMPFCVLDLQIRAHGTLHPPAPVSDPIRAVRTCALPLRTCLILPVCALFTVLLVCGCCDHNSISQHALHALALARLQI